DAGPAVGPLGRLRSVPDGAVGNGDPGRPADHLEDILGLAPVPLLAEPAFELGVCLHEHPRLGAVDPGVPGPLGLDDVAVAVEDGGVLAEVPDVAATVLGVVVAGPLLEDVVQVQPVLDDPGPDPADHLGPVRGGEKGKGPPPDTGAGVA